MSKPLSVGVIGAGVIVRQEHLPAMLRHRDRFRIVAIADTDKERGVSAAAEAGESVAVYTGYRKMLEDGDIEAVLVAVPPFLTAEISIDCLRAGKHVLAEKPMGNSETDARTLLEESKSRPEQALMVGENFYFYAGFEKLRQIARSGEWPFGPPVFVELHQFWKMTPKTIPQFYHSPWRHDSRLTWGYLIEGGCHMMNPVREAFGMVDKVQARMAQADPALGRYDTLLANGILEGGGIPFQATMGYGTRTFSGEFIQVYAKEGTIAVDAGGIRLFDGDGNITTLKARAEFENPYEAELVHFSRAVRNEASLEFTAAQAYGDVLCVQRMIDAAVSVMDEG